MTTYPGLPKWPQLIITGPDVDPEQAMDFILRTDGFLTEPCEFSGGNEHDFNNSYRERAGLNRLNNSEDFHAKWELQRKLRERIGFVDLRYVPSRFASCAYVYGPHGVVSPTGKVSHHHNVGKWPGVEDILSDFKALARAFPWLELWATVYDREWCEEDGIPLVTFRVKSGRARVVKTRDLKDNAPKTDRVSDITNYLRHGSGLGLPWGWYDVYADRVRGIIDEVTGSDVEENRK